ncbi:hypothetical protein ACIAIL_04745 [Raoultella ornithinolytica]|uniref:DUF551 domain-containing protein n=1 Tax=Raoultella ornithinolytica TaxID=54291 RepID=UPI003D6FD75B
MTSKLTRGALFAEVHNVPDDYHFTEEELDRIIAGDMFTPRQGAIMARELQERRKAEMDCEPVAYIDKQWTLVYYVPPMSMGLKIGDKLYRHAQPAPVVPEEKPMPNPLSMYVVDAVAAIAEAKGWNACRAAMLQELKKSAGTEAICRSDENVQVLHANPPVIPDGSASMLRRWLAFGRGMQNAGSQLPHNLIAETESMLAAAPHDTPALNSVQSVVTVPGKLIPVSEQKPDCWCLTCRPVVLNDMRFVVCPDCGNKRCPRANDHRDACTGSNEPGQEGSVYPAAPQEVKGE